MACSYMLFSLDHQMAPRISSYALYHSLYMGVKSNTPAKLSLGSKAKFTLYIKLTPASANFPEWYSNTNDDVSPDHESFTIDFVL